MRMGLRRSLTRDSAMSTDSLYSSLASSCRRKWVDFLTLQGREQPGEESGFVHIYTHICSAILITCEIPAYIFHWDQ